MIRLRGIDVGHEMQEYDAANDSRGTSEWMNHER